MQMKLRAFVVPWHVACPSVNTRLSALCIKLKYLDCYLWILYAVHKGYNIMGNMTMGEMYIVCVWHVYKI